jgi:hypothetical protein
MADEYVKLDDVLQLLNRNSITKTITFSDGISIYESVQNLPAADVVPRSEVEKIFEEIEKIIASHGITIGLVFDEAEGAAVAIGRIDRKIAEFKKEYTEEK